MPQKKVIGIVPHFRGNEFHLVAENAQEVDRFLENNGCTTHITRNRHGAPKIKIREKFAAYCIPGNRIAYTIEIKKNGSIHGIDIEDYGQDGEFRSPDIYPENSPGETNLLEKNKKSDGIFDENGNECGKNSKKNTLNVEHIKWYYKHWQGRHEDWAENDWTPFLQKLYPHFKYHDFNGFQKVLAQSISEDWRYALAFFIDRTTYQSMKDHVTRRIAKYLIGKIVDMFEQFTSKSLDHLVESIYQEKNNNTVTYVRVDKDIQRIESVAALPSACLS